MADKNILGTKTINGGTYSEMNVMGELTSTDDLNVEELNIMGSATFEGNLNVKSLDVLGPCQVNKNIKANEIIIAGTLKVLGNIDSTSFSSYGLVEVMGDLNVDDANICISHSKFNNIYGDQIKFGIGKKTNIFGFAKISFKTNPDIMTEINEIEATKIVLVNCKVNRVSGEDVSILDNCEIGTVEYSKKIVVSKNCKIDKIVKF